MEDLKTKKICGLSVWNKIYYKAALFDDKTIIWNYWKNQSGLYLSLYTQLYTAFLKINIVLNWKYKKIYKKKLKYLQTSVSYM